MTTTAGKTLEQEYQELMNRPLTPAEWLTVELASAKVEDGKTVLRLDPDQAADLETILEAFGPMQNALKELTEAPWQQKKSWQDSLLIITDSRVRGAAAAAYRQSQGLPTEAPTPAKE